MNATKTTSGTESNPNGRGRRAVALLVVTLAMAGTLAMAAKGGYRGDRAETETFLSWYRTIDLTAEQETIRVQALSALPAPCCKEFSAATCCCKCNMARAGWGLAKHLIAEKGAGVEEVRAEVTAWHRAINPGGFTGDACFTGGCGRSFANNGCGGMNEKELVF